MTGPSLSNSLGDLAERVKAAVDAQSAAEATAATQALAAGGMLLEARSQTTHGAWGAFLQRSNVHERQARRLMRLARSGLKPDTVSDLGGVKATLAWMRGLTLPGPGEALLALQDGDAAPFAVAVEANDSRGDLYDLVRVDAERVDYFKRPIFGHGVMPILLNMMLDDLPRLSFTVIVDGDGFWRDLVQGRGVFAERSDAA